MDSGTCLQAAQWATVKLSRAYPASFVEADAVEEKQRLYVELLEAHPWISAETWKAAIPWLVWHHDGDYAPGPAQLIEACREQHRKEQQAETNAKALPAPQTQPTRPDRNAFAWNVAIGRAMARKHLGLIAAYRKANGLDARAPVPASVWQGLDEPTEADIRAVAGEALPPMLAAVQSGPSWPGSNA
ncbi:MAG TPA: hypothetical protein VNM48_02365 [Chloroflexota bacterium]|nr:hypothetical protein [Chloroflexota bacterium]